MDCCWAHYRAVGWAPQFEVWSQQEDGTTCIASPGNAAGSPGRCIRDVSYLPLGHRIVRNRPLTKQKDSSPCVPQSSRLDVRRAHVHVHERRSLHPLNKNHTESACLGLAF